MYKDSSSERILRRTFTLPPPPLTPRGTTEEEEEVDDIAEEEKSGLQVPDAFVSISSRSAYLDGSSHLRAFKSACEQITKNLITGTICILYYRVLSKRGREVG